MKRFFTGFMLCFILVLSLVTGLDGCGRSRDSRSREASTQTPEATGTQEEAAATTRTEPAIPYYTKRECADLLREAMEQRKKHVTLHYKTNHNEDSTILDSLFHLAIEYTGVPTEGDALKWQYADWSASTRYETLMDDSWKNYYYTIEYDLTYYTTLEQEEALTQAISSLLKEMKVDEMSDAQKVRAIYDYICHNVTYDDTHLSDENYTLKYTAYAAFFNKTAVCQGFANLFYRMALEADLDARIISGVSQNESHSWNIVKVDGLYYNLDLTWDQALYVQGRDYAYFLKGTDNFPDHVRDKEYNTKKFQQQYYMAVIDYPE